MTAQITNDQLNQKIDHLDQKLGQLYELMKDFKADTNRQFDRIDTRMGRIEEDVRVLDQRTQRLEQQTNQTQNELAQVTAKIGQIHVSWNHKLVGGVLATSVTASALVVLLIHHAL